MIGKIVIDSSVWVMVINKAYLFFTAAKWLQIISVMTVADVSTLYRESGSIEKLISDSLHALITQGQGASPEPARTHIFVLLTSQAAVSSLSTRLKSAVACALDQPSCSLLSLYTRRKSAVAKFKFVMLVLPIFRNQVYKFLISFIFCLQS